MYNFILILALIVILLGCSAFTLVLLYSKMIAKKRREFYVFINEDGEEIPIGI